MSPADTFPVIIDSQRIMLRKGEMSPERWELDFGTISPQREYHGPPFSAAALTEIRLELEPTAKIADCQALLANYAFELRLNQKELMRGPVNRLNVGLSEATCAPRASAPIITLLDHLSGAVLLGPGMPFAASGDFSFTIYLLGFGINQPPRSRIPEPSATSDSQTKKDSRP